MATGFVNGCPSDVHLGGGCMGPDSEPFKLLLFIFPPNRELKVQGPLPSQRVILRTGPTRTARARGPGSLFPTEKENGKTKWESVERL